MNIYLHELRAYRKSTLIWSLSLIVIVSLFMSFYPSFAKDAEAFTEIMENYPKAVQQALGISLGTFFNILGFYCFPLSFITLFGAIQAMNLGTSIVSKEVHEKTADFLLTKPVTRQKVLLSKLTAAFTSILITNVLYLAASSFVLFQVKTGDFSYKVFLLLSLTLFFIQLLFLAIGVLISVLVPKVKSVLTVSLAVVFVFYFLGMLSDSGEPVKRYLSPFRYFDTGFILQNAAYEGKFLIAGAAVIAAAVAASFIVYLKRDIHAV